MDLPSTCRGAGFIEQWGLIFTCAHPQVPALRFSVSHARSAVLRVRDLPGSASHLLQVHLRGLQPLMLLNSGLVSRGLWLSYAATLAQIGIRPFKRPYRTGNHTVFEFVSRCATEVSDSLSESLG